MKKNKIAIFLLVFIVCVGCDKDKELDPRQPIVTNEEIVTTSNSASISWRIDFPGNYHAGIEISKNASMNDAQRIEVAAHDGVYSIDFDSLMQYTKYYYRQVVWNSYRSFVLETKHFMTKDICYTIKVIATPNDGGKVTGDGVYETGSQCTATAVANNGYTFINWSENGIVVSNNSEYSFIVNSDRTLVAKFLRTYVDLALPSGMLWATCNVGALFPEDLGNRYAWGETQQKTVYHWNTYRFCNGRFDRLTKYCNIPDYGNEGFVDDLTILQPQDDAAFANWDEYWRIPTKEDWIELYQNTTHTWTTQNNVDGLLFVASNGATLFLPGGYYYWSCSLDENLPYNAWAFWFSSGGCGIDELGRNCGLPIRPVCPK